MTVGHALLAFSIAAALLTTTPGLDTMLVLRTAAVEGLRGLGTTQSVPKMQKRQTKLYLV